LLEKCYINVNIIYCCKHCLSRIQIYHSLSPKHSSFYLLFSFEKVNNCKLMQNGYEKIISEVKCLTLQKVLTPKQRVF